mgnify:CR=1 FL=1
MSQSPESLAAIATVQQQLRPVFDPAWNVPVQAHFVVYPERHGYRPEVAKFLGWLRGQTRAEPYAGAAGVPH